MQLTLSRPRLAADRWFEDLFGSLEGNRSRGSTPSLDVWEDEEAFHLEADLPGVTMDDLEILVLGNELTLKGQRTIERQSEPTWHRRERAGGGFERILRFPTDLDTDRVDAQLEHGVLRITLPKAPSHRPRRIEVKQA